MGAIACHKAQGASFKYAPNPKNEPVAFGVFGLLITYVVVLTVGMIEDFSIEKFELAMNVAAIAGFAGLCAAFWRSGSPNHHAAPVSDPGMMPKKAGSHAKDQWGPVPTIGFLDEEAD